MTATPRLPFIDCSAVSSQFEDAMISRPGTSVGRAIDSGSRDPMNVSSRRLCLAGSASQSDALACGSRSIRSVRIPRSARAAANETAVVVLPLPPLRLTTAMIRIQIYPSDGHSAVEGRSEG